jgi:hypothetical protein
MLKKLGQASPTIPPIPFVKISSYNFNRMIILSNENDEVFLFILSETGGCKDEKYKEKSFSSYNCFYVSHQ